MRPREAGGRGEGVVCCLVSRLFEGFSLHIFTPLILPSSQPEIASHEGIL